MPRNTAQSRLDAMAKEKGFPNYAAMKAWNAKYRAPVTNSGQAPKKKNFLQSLREFHPIGWAQKRVSGTLDKKNKQ